MNEKELVKSTYAYNAKKRAIITFFVFFVLDFLMLLIYSIIEYGYYSCQVYNPITGMFETSYSTWSPGCIIDAFEELAVPAIIILLLGIILAFIVCKFKSELTVTDKRVFGMGIFGKRIDLPLDSVSAIGSLSFFQGVSIATAAGSIKFFGIKNYKEIHNVLSKLIIERQEQKNEEKPYQVVQNQSNADELRKYKDLLDNGIITQEEFDAKKKQLLGL